MKIKVKLFATLRTYSTIRGGSVCELDIAEDTRVQGALDLLKIPAEIPKIVLINGMQRELEDPLSDGDVLSVFPPIAGG